MGSSELVTKNVESKKSRKAALSRLLWEVKQVESNTKGFEWLTVRPVC